MKRTISFLTAAMLIGIMPVKAQSAALAEYGFENSETGIYASYLKSPSVTSVEAKSGRRSLCFPAEEGNEYAIALWNIPNAASKNYTVSVQMKADSGVNYALLGYEYKDADGNQIRMADKDSAGNDSAKAIPNGGWGNYTFSFSLDNGIINDLRLRMEIRGTGNVYIDDIIIYEGTVDTPEKNDYPNENFSRINQNQRIYRTIYVDGDANSGDGTKESPFGRISDAQELVRSISDDMDGDISVKIKGRHFLDESLIFDERDSGKNGYCVVWEGEYDAVVSGGKRILNWRGIGGGIYAAACDCDDVRNIYVNDKRAVRARYDGAVVPKAWYDDTSDSLTNRDGFIIPSGIINEPEKAKELEIYRECQFRSGYAKAENVFLSDGSTVIEMHQPYFYAHEMLQSVGLTWDYDDEIRLENCLEFLDTPGEWYFDKDDRLLYYMPHEGEDMNTAEVIVPQIGNILRVSAADIDTPVKNIIFKGITFEHGANLKKSVYGMPNSQATMFNQVTKQGYFSVADQIHGNISVETAENIVFEGNTIKHMGSCGIELPCNVYNCELRGNIITDTSSSGISIGCGNCHEPLDNRTIPTNISVSDNMIYDVSAEYTASPAITSYYTEKLSITNNEIHDCPYSGISMGWGWETRKDSDVCRQNEIKYNKIYNTNKILSDGAPIYTLGQQPESQIAYNHIIVNDIITDAIYHDQGSMYFDDEYNVIDMPESNISGWAFVNSKSASEIVLKNNYVTNTYHREFPAGVTDENNRYLQNRSYPQEACDIIESAGIGRNFRHIADESTSPRKIRRIMIASNVDLRFLKSGDRAVLTIKKQFENGETEDCTDECLLAVSNTGAFKLDGNILTALAPGATSILADMGGISTMAVAAADDKPKQLCMITNEKSFKTGQKSEYSIVLYTEKTRYILDPSEYLIESSDNTVAGVAGKNIETFNEGICDFKITADFGTAKTTGFNRIYVYDKLNTCAEVTDALSEMTPAEFRRVFKFNGEMPEEKEFAEGLARFAGCEISDFANDASKVPMTRERCAYILSEFILKEYGLCHDADNSLTSISDKMDISAEYVPYVAHVLRYEMGKYREFMPKKQMTADECADGAYNIIFAAKNKTVEASRRWVGEWEEYLRGKFIPPLDRSRRIGYASTGSKTIPMNVTAYKGTCAIDYENCDDDVFSIAFTKNENNATLIYNNAGFEAGKRYKVEFAAKGADGMTFIAVPNVVRGAGVRDFGYVNGSFVSSEWKNYSFDVTIPAGSELYANQIFINAYSQNTGDIFYISGMKICEVPELRAALVSASISEPMKLYDKLEIVYTAPPAQILEACVTDGVVKSAEIRNENSAVLDFSELDADTEYTVSITVRDIYGGEWNGQIRFKTAEKKEANLIITNPNTVFRNKMIEMTSDVPLGEINRDMFGIDNNAAVTGAVKLDDYNISVRLSGLRRGTSYKLSVDGVKDAYGISAAKNFYFETEKPDIAAVESIDYETAADGAKGMYKGNVTSINVSDKYSFSGKRALEVSTATGNNTIGFNINELLGMTLERNKSYYISCRVYVPKEYGKITIGMYKHGETSFTRKELADAGIWIPLSGVFTAENASNNLIMFYANFAESNTGSFYIDDFSAAELSNNGVYVSNVEYDAGDVVKLHAEVVNAGELDKRIYVVFASFVNNCLVYDDIKSETILGGSSADIHMNVQKGDINKLFVWDSEAMEPYVNAIEIK